MNLTSSAVKETNDGLLLSNVFRPGVIGWAKTISRDEARHGITVNSIAPGYIGTERLVQLYSSEADPDAAMARDADDDPGRPVRHAGGDRRCGGVPVLDRRRLHERHDDAGRRRPRPRPAQLMAPRGRVDWAQLARPSLAGIEPYDPGESRDELKERHGLADLAPLNWNEDLFGPPQHVLDAAAAEVARAALYPERAYSDFRAAVAGWIGVPAACVVPAHGAQALIGAVAAVFVDPGTAVVIPQHDVRPVRPALRGGRGRRSRACRRMACGSTSARSPRPPGRSRPGSCGCATPTTPPAF